MQLSTNPSSTVSTVAGGTSFSKEDKCDLRAKLDVSAAIYQSGSPNSWIFKLQCCGSKPVEIASRVASESVLTPLPLLNPVLPRSLASHQPLSQMLMRTTLRAFGR
jgi:hypothetical protein